MSDSSQGEGWWQASDGKWYPPEQSQSAPPPPPPTSSQPPGPPVPPPPSFASQSPPPPAPKKSGVSKGLLIGLATCGGLFLVVIVVGALLAAGGDDDDVTTASPSADGTADGDEESPGSDAACKDTPADQSIDTQVVGLYPERVGVESDNDHESVVGDCVRISGMSGWVTGVEAVTDFSGDPIMRVSVRIQNRDEEAKPYGTFEWSLQTKTGQISSTTIDFDATDGIGTGEVAAGGEVTGTVSFDAGPGTYFVIWEPGFLAEDRGVWEVSV